MRTVQREHKSAAPAHAISGGCTRWAWMRLFVLVIGAHLAAAQTAYVLVGSGSTVPAPLYNRWAAEYGKRNPNLQMRYLALGTEEGIRQIAHGSGDFGAGEAPLTEKQRKEDGLVELPAALIGIVPIYNLPGVHQQLHLSGDILADIFLGQIKTWNAPQIAKLNPEIALPNLPIQVVHRPAGKGSNYVFSDFLSKTSAKFRAQVNVSASPKWPVGEVAERSTDMAEKVKAQPGAIGYVEYEYAVKDSVQQAAIQNAAGKFVVASPRGLLAACEAVEAPRWHSFSVSLTNARGVEAFPITSFTWIFLPAKTSDVMRAAAQKDLLGWIYSDGQSLAEREGYTALPAQLVTEVKKELNAVR